MAQMEPLSIIVSCVSLLRSVIQLSSYIRNFSVQVTEASKEISALQADLLLLESLLTTLKSEIEGDPASENAIPEETKLLITGSMESCKGMSVRILELLEKFEKNSLARRLVWADHGRAEALRLHETLKGHCTALKFAVQLIQLLVSTKFYSTHVLN